MEYPPEGPPDCEVQQEYIPPYRSDDKSDKSDMRSVYPDPKKKDSGKIVLTYR